MKNKIAIKGIYTTIILLYCCIWGATQLNAQDSRERIYNYEILTPSHQSKPRVEGYATHRITENLGRGLVASLSLDGKGVYLSWRMLAADHEDVGFNIYRKSGASTKLLNNKPIINSSDFCDTMPISQQPATYWIEPCYNLEKLPISKTVEVDFKTLLNKKPYRSITLKGADKAGKIGVADLNGDGEYDFIIRTPSSNVDPGMPGDSTGITYTISAYLHNGTYLWSYNLGEGIEPGIWYSPFVAYDFNGDGRAEVALKVCPNGKRNDRYRVDAGDEYLVVLDGISGKELARAPWIERSWRLGDLNRQNRNQIGLAFLDGKTPSIITMRGTYRAMIADAWQFNNGKLTRQWRWDGDEENPVVRSQGAHNMIAADVDGDGRDEILLGGCMIDDNGALLWSAGIGHPDKAYLTQIDPSRPGMQVFLCGEVWHDDGRGVSCVDAATGQQVWNINHPTTHVGDGMVADFDPTHPGLECIGTEDSKAGHSDRYLLSAKGEKIDAKTVPPCRDWVWWDADKLRETVVSKGGKGRQIVKWPNTVVSEGIEGDILMITDLDGDWREEIITAVDNELRIYSTRIAAKDRRVTLMQDPLYRSYVAERSQGYPQAPVPSYYLGE